MNTQIAFPIESILSVTTGILLAEMGSLYEILNYLTGDELWTHQLPRASDVCKPAILFQHPQLAEIDASHVNRDNWYGFVWEMKNEFGDALPLHPIVGWQNRNPIEEAVEMFGENKVVGISPDATKQDIKQMIDNITDAE